MLKRWVDCIHKFGYTIVCQRLAPSVNVPSGSQQRSKLEVAGAHCLVALKVGFFNEKIQYMNKWHKRPPEHSKWVLVRYNQWTGVARYIGDKWESPYKGKVDLFEGYSFTCTNTDCIQEWTNLPEPPDVQ